MKKYVIKKKGEDKWVYTWVPFPFGLLTSPYKDEAMKFDMEPIHVMKFYDKLNEFEIVPL